MSSEEMRAELEIFVNNGLREGWRGWPLKSQASQNRSGRGRAGLTPLRVWRRGRSRPLARRGRLGLLAISA